MGLGKQYAADSSDTCWEKDVNAQKMGNCDLYAEATENIGGDEESLISLD